MHRVRRVLAGVRKPLSRAIRALRPRGTPAATAAAAIAGLTAASLVGGAVVTATTGRLLPIEPLAWPGLVSEAKRSQRALAGVSALAQMGLALVFVAVAVSAWSGRPSLLQLLVGSDGVSFAIVLVAVVFAGIALNAAALVLVACFLAQVNANEEYETQSDPPPLEAMLGMLGRRRTFEPLPVPDGPAVEVLQGQVGCPQCGLPNAAGRRRCRVCATRFIPVPQVA